MMNRRSGILSALMVLTPLVTSHRGCLAAQQPPPGVASGVTGRELFALDLAGTPVGDLPNSINLLKGDLAVATRNGLRMLKASTPSEFLITLSEVLPQDFTIQFDLVPKLGSNPQDLSVEGTRAVNQGDGSAHVLWHATGYLSVIGGGGDTYESPMPEDLRATLPGVLTKVVVQVQGARIKLYTNGRLLFAVQKKFARGLVLRVFLGGQNDGTEAVYLAGLRIAAGTPGSVAEGGKGTGSEPAGGLATGTNSSASTGTTTSGGAGVRAAGTGAIATTAPSLVTASTPQTGGAQLLASPTTPKIVSITPLSTTWTLVEVENTPETIPDAAQYRWDHFIVERRSVDDPDACPANFLSPPDPSRCYRRNWPWTGRIDDDELEPGISYVYRVASVYSMYNCDECERVFPSLPVTFARSAQLQAYLPARGGLSVSSVEPRNVEVTRLTDRTVAVTWTAMGLNQQNPAAPSEKAWGWLVDQWIDGAPSTCPSVGASSLYVPDPTNCTRAIIYGAHHTQAWVATGSTNVFRVASLFGTSCVTGCASLKAYAAPPVSYAAPVVLDNARPASGSLAAVPPRLFLQVIKQGWSYSEWGCDSWSRCRKRDVDFAWAPTSIAVGYIISVDEVQWFPWGEEDVEMGVRSVPAGPAPEIRFALYTGSTVRACLAIVRDLNAPPNPRNGECLEVEVKP